MRVHWRLQQPPARLALLPLRQLLELLHAVRVHLHLQLVGALVQLPHQPELALQLRGHVGHACSTGKGQPVSAPALSPLQAGAGSSWQLISGPAQALHALVMKERR